MSGFVVALIEPLPVDQLHLPSFIVEIRGQRWSRGPVGSETFPIDDKLFQARMTKGEMCLIHPIPITSIQKIVLWAGLDFIDDLHDLGLDFSKTPSDGQIEGQGFFWLLFPQDARRWIETTLLDLSRIAFRPMHPDVSSVMARISPDHPWTLSVLWMEAKSEEDKEVILDQWIKSAHYFGPPPLDRQDARRQIETACQTLHNLLREH